MSIGPRTAALFAVASLWASACGGSGGGDNDGMILLGTTPRLDDRTASEVLSDLQDVSESMTGDTDAAAQAGLDANDAPDPEAEPSTGAAPDAGSEPEAPPPEEAEPLVVSIIITDLTMVAAALGWEVPDQGDLEAAIETLVAHINSAGGVAGHPIQPAIQVFNAITDSPISEEQLCKAVTEGDEADVVVLTGQFQDNARPCYAAAGTLMLDMSLYPVDDASYEALAPYLWSPILPSYSDLMGVLVDVLESENWLDGTTVGVISVDTEPNRRVTETVLAPRLSRIGIEPAVISWVDPTDSTSWVDDLNEAVLAFEAAGVDGVIAVGGARLLPYLINVGAPAGFSPAYAVTSYDNPEYNIRNTPEEMIGALGITVLPGWDIQDDQYPPPANAAEELCLTVLASGGMTYESRANSREALLYCDALRLLQQAGRHAASLSAEDLRSAIWALGGSFEPASVYSVAFDEGGYAGGAGYRVFAFDETCSCMAVTSDTILFGS